MNETILNPGHKKEFEKSKAQSDIEGMIRSLQEQVNNNNATIKLIEGMPADHEYKLELPQLMQLNKQLQAEIKELQKSYKPTPQLPLE